MTSRGELQVEFRAKTLVLQCWRDEVVGSGIRCADTVHILLTHKAIHVAK